MVRKNESPKHDVFLDLGLDSILNSDELSKKKTIWNAMGFSRRVNDCIDHVKQMKSDSKTKYAEQIADFKRLFEQSQGNFDKTIEVLRTQKRLMYPWLDPVRIAAYSAIAITIGLSSAYAGYKLNRPDTQVAESASAGESLSAGFEMYVIQQQNDQLYAKIQEMQKEHASLQKKNSDLESRMAARSSSSQARGQNHAREQDYARDQKQAREQEQKAGHAVAAKPQAVSNKDYYYFPVRGDTLSKIAYSISGNMEDWRRIQRYNGLRSDLIEVNQILHIPPDMVRDASHLYTGSIDCMRYEAKPGDTLESISKKLYGDEKYAKFLLSYNQRYNPRFSSRIYNKEWVFIPKG